MAFAWHVKEHHKMLHYSYHCTLLVTCPITAGQLQCFVSQLGNLGPLTGIS